MKNKQFILISGRLPAYDIVTQLKIMKDGHDTTFEISKQQVWKTEAGVSPPCIPLGLEFCVSLWCYNWINVKNSWHFGGLFCTEYSNFSPPE